MGIYVFVSLPEGEKQLVGGCLGSTVSRTGECYRLYVCVNIYHLVLALCCIILLTGAKQRFHQSRSGSPRDCAGAVQFVLDEASGPVHTAVERCEPRRFWSNPRYMFIEDAICQCRKSFL